MRNWILLGLLGLLFIEEIDVRRDTPMLKLITLGNFTATVDGGFVDEFEEVVVESEFPF